MTSAPCFHCQCDPCECRHIGRRYLLAEFCAAEFYYGWWLYEREHNDGRPNSVGNYWGWLRDRNESSPQNRTRDLCVRMGHAPPPVEGCSQDFAEWFARTFPAGLEVQVYTWYGDRRYDLMQVVPKLPRQRRGTIRTIQGARRARLKVAGKERDG